MYILTLLDCLDSTRPSVYATSVIVDHTERHRVVTAARQMLADAGLADTFTVQVQTVDEGSFLSHVTAAIAEQEA